MYDGIMQLRAVPPSLIAPLALLLVRHSHPWGVLLLACQSTSIHL
jgi:hypothetical protein